MIEPSRSAIPLDRLDAVLFDTDGVLTDTASVHAAAWKRLFDEYLTRAARLGEPFHPFEQSDYLRHVDGRPRHDGVAASWPPGASPCPRATRPTRRAARRSAASARPRTASSSPTSATTGRTPSRPRPRWCIGCGPPGLQTAAVSASRNMLAVLESAGLRDLFDALVDGVEAARLGLPGKPDPALFLEAARRLGVPAGAGRGRRGRPGRGGGRPPGRVRPGRRRGPGRPGRRPGRAGRRRGRRRPGRARRRRPSLRRGDR